MLRRVKIAKKALDQTKGKDRKLKREYDDASKDLYAYVRLMELCQSLNSDLMEMRQIIESVARSSMGVAPDDKLN